MGIFSSVSLPAMSMPIKETNLISGCAERRDFISSFVEPAFIKYNKSVIIRTSHHLNNMENFSIILSFSPRTFV